MPTVINLLRVDVVYGQQTRATCNATFAARQAARKRCPYYLALNDNNCLIFTELKLSKEWVYWKSIRTFRPCSCPVCPSGCHPKENRADLCRSTSDMENHLISEKIPKKNIKPCYSYTEHNRSRSCRTNLKQFIILYQGPKIWNSLPISITSSSSFFTFKEKMLEVLFLKSWIDQAALTQHHIFYL